MVSQQQDLQRLRHREPEPEAGTHVDLPHCGTRHDRNLNAAINLRNLIMPVGRSRNGRGQESLVSQQRDLQRLRDRERKLKRGTHGEPGIVKDVPPGIRECGRGADGGTVVEGPARGSRIIVS